ncbi:MAG: hypothetical protein IJB20_01695, partial [Clostridia bacterium]|nr:hypothetical protein [Clostridia bacterium]
FSPNPFQKTLNYLLDRVCADLKYISCTAVQVFQICTALCQSNRLKVFEDGVWGRNFFQKVSSPIIIMR